MRWKYLDFISKTVYRERYKKLERKKPSASPEDVDLTPLKELEVLFGNKIERIRKETESYAETWKQQIYTLTV